jgi:putative oxidoreductase
MTSGMNILRIVLGALFAGHGSQKLFGWFGGHGLDGTGGFFEMLGLRPGRHHAIAAGAAEAGGGLLLAANTRVPVGEAALSGTMITAIRHAHAGKGPWVTDGGWEYPLVLLAAIFALSEERYGTAWATGQLLLGAAGSVAAGEYAKRQPAAQEPEADAARADAQHSANGDAAMAATAPAGAAPGQQNR